VTTGRLSTVAPVLLAATLAACGGGDVPGPPAPPPPRDIADPAIERFLDDTLPRGASGTVAAARDGELVHCAGFGASDREAGIAARCDTVYDVMSMTKQFTAAAILKLELLGKLAVTDPIGRHIGTVPPDKRAITLHHLLTHTSGLVERLGDDYDPVTRDELIAAALESELQAPPGTRYAYSNAGYSLLAAIVEQASGMTFERFLLEHVVGPAGMRSTGYAFPVLEDDEVAVEYDPDGEPQGRPFDHPWAADGPYWNLRGNGGLLSTARDMFRWHRALEGDAVLDDRAKRKLFQAHVREEPGGASFYGYGWVVQDGIAWHNGGNGWSYGELTRLPERRAMVFWISNRYRGDGWNLERLGGELTGGIAERLTG
jgi:CubicO group peptidase (beta-lactamase class C family)